jgi:hypothetical protein
MRALVELREEMDMEYDYSTPADVLILDSYVLLRAFSGLPVLMRRLATELEQGTLDGIDKKKQEIFDKLEHLRNALESPQETMRVIHENVRQARVEKKNQEDDLDKTWQKQKEGAVSKAVRHDSWKVGTMVNSVGEDMKCRILR